MPSGNVLGVEFYPKLTSFSEANINRDDPHLLTSGAVSLVTANAHAPEILGQGPFDAIHVGAASPDFPLDLVDALAPGGTLVVPVDTHAVIRQQEIPGFESLRRGGYYTGGQILIVVRKDDSGRPQGEALLGVSYVPLVPL